MPLYTSYAHSHRFTTTPTYSTLNRTYSSLSVPCYMEENVSPIYCVSGGVDTIFRGKKSEGRNFYKNRQKITDISAIYRFQAINRWYNGKKGQKKKNRRYFGRSMHYSVPSKFSFSCAVEGIRTRPPGQACPLLNILHLKYIFKVIM